MPFKCFRRDKGWPSFCRIIGWIVCVLTILGGAFIVLSYGLQFGNDMTYQWVVSMLISFFSSVIITQPIKVIRISHTISSTITPPLNGHRFVSTK